MRSLPAGWPGGPSPARVALRHSQLRRCHPVAGRGGLPGHRPVRARLRDHPLPVRRHAPQRPAGGPSRGCHRADGCARHREGHPGRLRLGGAVGRCRRGAVAGPLPGPGLGQRVPDRQPGRRRGTAAAAGRAHLVVPVLLRHRPRPGRIREYRREFSKLIWQLASPRVGLRRRHVRAQRGRLRQPRSRRHRDPQLPLADRPGQGRTAIRRPGAATCRSSAHRRASITLEGDANGAPHADASAYAANSAASTSTG